MKAEQKKILKKIEKGIFALSLNPLKVDTDGNGKKDGDEDADKDKLSNVEEIKYFLYSLLYFILSPIIQYHLQVML